MDFTIFLAGVSIGIHSIYDEVYTLCKKYLRDDATEDFSVFITQQDIRYEAEKSIREALYEGNPVTLYSDSYLETLAVYRKIAVGLLQYHTYLMHGSVVSVDGQAYLFTAPSGVGKTTHTRLWLEHIPGAEIVNGDKPLLQVRADGVYACGTPWAGKEGMNRNCTVPLRAICILQRGLKNQIEEVSFQQIYPVILQQTYRPAQPEAMKKTMELISEMSGSVRFYRMSCNMEPEAAWIAYQEMREHYD